MIDSTGLRTSISRPAFHALWIMATALAAPVQAMDIAPGDYTVPPPGTTLALYYGQYSSSQALHVDDTGFVADSEMNSQVNLLRFVHYGEIGSLPFAVQAIVPFGEFERARVGGIERKTVDGMGDVVLAASIYPIQGQNPGDMTIGLSAFLAIPTGEYAPDAISIGSGTTTATVQLGIIRLLTARLSLDAAVDVSLTADHTEAGVEYSQDPQAEAQTYLRFAISPQTHLSVGYAGFFGGKRHADGIYQGMSAEAHQLRVFADTFVTPSVHVQGMVGRDLSRQDGFEADLVAQLRLLKMF